MKRGVSRAVCLLVAMALLGVGVSAPSSPDAQATSVDPRSVQATFVGSAMFEGRLLPVDAQGRVFMERGGIWVPVGAVKPAQTQASTTSLAADRDQDKVVDALEAIYGNNDDRPMRVMVSVGRETLVDANRAVLGEGGTVTRIIGAGPDAVIAARLDRDGAQKVAQLDGVIAVWPDLVVSVSPPRTLESTPTSGVPSASVEPQDALRGLPALRTAQGVTGAGIDVAVIDTGVDARHTSISGRVAHRQNFVTTDSGCSYGSPGVGDGNGHGTHVAGIIAGSGSVGGVAPGARIVGLRVLTCSGSGQNSDIVAAIDWLAANRNNAGLGLNVRVANISLGSFSCYTLFDGTDPMSIAVNRLVAAGVATYVAAGNSADRDGCGVLGTVGTPGAADYGTTVGASTPEQSQGVDLAFFSSRGLYNQARTKPEFSVPGANIRSAKANTSNFAAGTSVTDWVTMSGTSMATPFAAGLAALALQRRPELVPSGTSCEVAADCPLGVVGASMSLPLRDLEISTAIDRGAAGVDMVWGHGLADPYAILGTTGTAYPVGTATVLNVATDMMDAKLRLTVAENKPVSLSFHRVVASLSTTNIKAHGGVSIPYVTLRRLSDGVELPMYTGHFVSSGYISWLLNGRTWNTGATNIAPGRYELQVFITGMTGDLLVTGSNVSSIVPTSSLVTVSTPSGVVRPGSSSSITITNNAAYALTAKAVDLNAVTDLSDAGAEIAAGQSRTVNFAVPAGATASATRLYAEVTASSVSEDVGTRSGSRNIVIRAGMAAASAGAFPAAERVDGNADGTSFSPPFRDSFEPGMGSRMSADGSVVAFWKEGTLVTSDGVNQTGSDGHVYIRDRVAGTTVLMGGTTLRSSITKLWDLSDDGDLVVFSTTKNLVVGDTNASNCNDLYTYRRSTGVFTLVGVLPAGYTSPCVGSMDVNEMQADLSPDGTKVLWARSGDMGPGTKVFRLSWFVTTLSPVSTTLINAPHDGSATPSSGTKMFTQPAWNAASDTVVFYTP
ncbi:MAG: S8 family serine peptidase, partial [Acidimicrobiales bacterium]